MFDRNIYITMFSVILLTLGLLLLKYLKGEPCVEPRFSYIPDQPFAGDRIRFVPENTNAEILTWDFGDGHASTENSPEYAYRKPGKYTVALKVSGNCFMNAEVTIKERVTVKRITPDVAPPFEINAGEPTFFNDQTPGATKISWTMEDRIVPLEGKEVSYTFSKPGNKKVSVSVKGDGFIGDTVFYVDVMPPLKAVSSPVVSSAGSGSGYSENETLKALFNSYRASGKTVKGNQLKDQIKNMLCDGESTPLTGDPASDVRNKYSSFYDLVFDIENIAIITSVKVKKRGGCISDVRIHATLKK